MKVTSRGLGFIAGEAKATRAPLALAVAVAVMALGCTGVASAAPAGSEDYRPSEWVRTADEGTASPTPSLTNDIGEPASGGDGALTIGLCLLGIGALGVVVGLTAMLNTPRCRGTGRSVPGGGWRGARGLPSGTAARP